MDDGSSAVPWSGWNRGLREHPEQPVLFFLRGGEWRWWSYRELETAGARVAVALPDFQSGAGLDQRVCFGLDRPQKALAVDLGVRTLGRTSAPRRDLVEAIANEPRFCPPDLGDGDRRGKRDAKGEFHPVGNVEVSSTDGQEVWTSERLASGVSALTVVLETVPEGDATGARSRKWGAKGRPIALATGALDRLEERLWVEWAADRDAVLVLVGSEDALPWASSWIRPHCVLGSPAAARAALEFAHEHEGSGRWARGFRRLERWVLTGGEAPSGSASIESPDLIAGWAARGVTLAPFLPEG